MLVQDNAQSLGWWLRIIRLDTNHGQRVADGLDDSSDVNLAGIRTIRSFCGGHARACRFGDIVPVLGRSFRWWRLCLLPRETRQGKQQDDANRRPRPCRPFPWAVIAPDHCQSPLKCANRIGTGADHRKGKGDCRNSFVHLDQRLGVRAPLVGQQTDDPLVTCKFRRFAQFSSDEPAKWIPPPHDPRRHVKPSSPVVPSTDVGQFVN